MIKLQNAFNLLGCSAFVRMRSDDLRWLILNAKVKTRKDDLSHWIHRVLDSHRSWFRTIVCMIVMKRDRKCDLYKLEPYIHFIYVTARCMLWNFEIITLLRNLKGNCEDSFLKSCAVIENFCVTPYFKKQTVPLT